MRLISKAYRRRSKVTIINLIYYAPVIYHNSIQCSHASSWEMFFLIFLGGRGIAQSSTASETAICLCATVNTTTHPQLHTRLKHWYSWPYRISTGKFPSGSGHRSIYSIFTHCHYKKIETFYWQIKETLEKKTLE